jgi:hypothetical protein
MRASLNDYWRRSMTSAAPQSTTERKPPQGAKQQSTPAKPPAIQLYFAVGLRRFPLLQSDALTPENVLAAVEHAAKLMQQKAEAR